MEANVRMRGPVWLKVSAVFFGVFGVVTALLSLAPGAPTPLWVLLRAAAVVLIVATVGVGTGKAWGTIPAIARRFPRRAGSARDDGLGAGVHLPGSPRRFRRCFACRFELYALYGRPRAPSSSWAKSAHRRARYARVQRLPNLDGFGYFLRLRHHSSARRRCLVSLRMRRQDLRWAVRLKRQTGADVQLAAPPQ